MTEVFTTDSCPSLVDRVGDPTTKHNPILVWTLGDYSSVRVVSSLSFKANDDAGVESCELQSLSDVFGDGDGDEWWTKPMSESKYRKLLDCTIFA